MGKKVKFWASGHVSNPRTGLQMLSHCKEENQMEMNDLGSCFGPIDLTPFSRLIEWLRLKINLFGVKLKISFVMSVKNTSIITSCYLLL